MHRTTTVNNWKYSSMTVDSLGNKNGGFDHESAFRNNKKLNNLVNNLWPDAEDIGEENFIEEEDSWVI